MQFIRNTEIEINGDKINGGVEDIKKINDRKDLDLSVICFSNPYAHFYVGLLLKQLILT